MKHLYLIRHAKSSWADSQLSDFDRPLNKRGKRDAPVMGQRLAARKIHFDLLLSSSARRARKTAVCIAAEIGYSSDDIKYDTTIYEAGTATLLSIIRHSDPGVESLALVGHNHVITEVAELLTGRRIVNIPTSGIVAISFTGDTWKDIGPRTGRLLFFDYPKLEPEQSST
ncbi:MAG: histidine phosphatase family protein [Desulfocapsaceae bacterium]|nr:histidine phosphatase family protein [Desulfocapsaceae bacterium]